MIGASALFVVSLVVVAASVPGLLILVWLRWGNDEQLEAERRWRKP